MRHHYVPQFLLRRWINASGKLHTFAIRNGGLVRSQLTPKYTGYEPGLYAIAANVFGLSKDHIEKKLFAPIDDRAAKVLEKLERRERISEDEHIAWIFFLAAFLVRQPATLDFLRAEGMDQVRCQLANRDAATLPKNWPTTEQWLDANFPGGLEAASLTAFLPRMIAHPQVMDAFTNTKWWIREFEPSTPKLLLSNMPIHTENPLKDDNFSIRLPISPDRIFFGTRSADTEQFLARLPSTDLVERVNRTTLASSTGLIWASTGEDAHAFIETNLDVIGKNVIGFRDVVRYGDPLRDNLKHSGE